jgi:polyisoprenoid-binding protein YceI
VTDVWTIDAADGELTVRTAVAGPAAKMGHRLTIAMRRWEATVMWSAGEPVAAQLEVEVDSLEVLQGQGGLTPLSGPEKTLVRSNALRQLDVKRFPQIRFETDGIERTEYGYRLAGMLQIRGKARRREVTLHTEDLGNSWRLSAQAVVRQSDFGVKPYSLLMGSLKLADDVTVAFTAQHGRT